MKRLVLIVLIVFSATSGWGQDAEQDIKVGLVLSGGGAKGLAHIGALKVIEDSGIRVDYIGGTSMGAIVGGLYAAGYSANDLDSIFNTLDFEKLIQDDIPRSAKTFYEKKESQRYALTLPFDGFRIGFPSGISKGQNVYNLLSKLTTHVGEVSDFNDLPIPFLCITTNVETGRAVVLDKGYLPRAITASGALPSLFSPVKIGDSLYVDGGVVNNYPIDEVRAMGADVIIGIDVQDSLKAREDLQSAIKVLGQINNYRTINAMVEKAGQTDLYIKPNIDDFNVVSFDQGNAIIGSGEQAARKSFEALKALAARQKGPQPQRLSPPPVQNEIFIRSVEIRGTENYSRAYVLGKLKLRTPSKITYDRFSEGVNNLSATGNFDGINYRFVEDQDNTGEYTVIFDLVESKARTLLRLGVHYDDLFKTAALINMTRKRLLTNNDIASFDFVVGDFIRYNFDYYIDKGYYWSVGVSSSYNFFDKNVAVDFIRNDLSPIVPLNANTSLSKIDFEYGDLTNRLYVQTLFQRIFQLELGGEHKWLKYFSETIQLENTNTEVAVFEDTNYFSAYGLLKFDTFDNVSFPNSGLLLEGDFHWYLLATGQNNDFEPFSIAKAKAYWAYSFTDKLSTILGTEGGLSIGSTTTSSLDFMLGGYGFHPLNNIMPLLGYEALSLRGDTYLKSMLTLDYEFARKHHVNLSGNIANVGDDLFGTGQWIDGIDHYGFGMGYGWDTFLGPVELKYTYSPETGNSVWFVNVGFSF